MSIYGKYSQCFLDNIANISLIHDKVRDQYSELYNILLDYNYNIPTNTDDILTFVLTFDRYTLDFANSLYSRRDNRNYGYNHLLFKQIQLGDTKYLLKKVKNDSIRKLIKPLTTVDEKFSQNYHYLQLLLLLYSESRIISHKYVYDYLINYKYKLPFQYTFRYLQHNPIDNIYNYRSAFISIILHNIVKQCIFIAQAENVIKSFFKSNDVQISFVSDFESFLDSNIDLLTEQFYKFVVNNNIFVYTESNHFKKHVSNVIKEYLKTSFRDLIENFIYAYLFDVNYISSVIVHCFSSYLSYLMLNDQIYYENIVRFFDIDTNYLLSIEDTLYTSMTRKFSMEYSEDLEDIQYIATQWKDNGLFFLNSQQYLHYEWLFYIVNQTDYKTLIDFEHSFSKEYDIMSTILDKFNISSSNNIGLVNYISSFINKSYFGDVIDSVIKDEFLYCLYSAIDSDEFQASILADLIPKLFQDINKDYYFINDQTYVYVDHVKLFFKSMFGKYTFVDNIFSDTISSIVDNLWSDFGASLSINEPRQILDKQSAFYKHYFEFFNRYFITVRTVQYVNDFLDHYRIYIS